MTKIFLSALCLAVTSAIELVSQSATQQDCDCGSQCNASAQLSLELGSDVEPFTSDFCLSTAQYFSCCSNGCGVQCDCDGITTFGGPTCCNTSNEASIRIETAGDISGDLKGEFDGFDWANFGFDCEVEITFTNEMDEGSHRVIYYDIQGVQQTLEIFDQTPYAFTYYLGAPIFVEWAGCKWFPGRYELIAQVDCIGDGLSFHFG